MREGPLRVLVTPVNGVLAASAATLLKRAGYELAFAVDLAAAVAALRRRRFDLILASEGDGPQDALELCDSAARDPAIKLLLVRRAADAEGRAEALERGADDCVDAGTPPREILARARALLRRRDELAFGGCDIEGVVLDYMCRELRGLDGRRVRLTDAQFALLRAFVLHPERVLSRDELLELCARRGPDPLDRSVDGHVSTLRRLLAGCGRPGVIHTVRGAGYVLNVTVRPARVAPGRLPRALGACAGQGSRLDAPDDYCIQ